MSLDVGDKCYVAYAIKCCGRMDGYGTSLTISGFASVADLMGMGFGARCVFCLSEFDDEMVLALDTAVRTGYPLYRLEKLDPKVLEETQELTTCL